MGPPLRRSIIEESVDGDDRGQMTVFDVASILIAVAALSGYVNHRLLRLPPTSGTLLVALVSSLVVVVIEQVVPGVQLRPAVERFVSQIDFDQALMQADQIEYDPRE